MDIEIGGKEVMKREMAESSLFKGLRSSDVLKHETVLEGVAFNFSQLETSQRQGRMDDSGRTDQSGRYGREIIEGGERIQSVPCQEFSEVTGVSKGV